MTNERSQRGTFGRWDRVQSQLLRRLKKAGNARCSRREPSPFVTGDITTPRRNRTEAHASVHPHPERMVPTLMFCVNQKERLRLLLTFAVDSPRPSALVPPPPMSRRQSKRRDATSCSRLHTVSAPSRSGADGTARDSLENSDLSPSGVSHRLATAGSALGLRHVEKRTLSMSFSLNGWSRRTVAGRQVKRAPSRVTNVPWYKTEIIFLPFAPRVVIFVAWTCRQWDSVVR